MKIKNLPDKLVWAAIILYAAFFSYLSILKYNNFIYNDFDLAIDSQALWNIIHGSCYSSIHQMVFLGNHMRLVLFLITPLYAVFTSPVLLLVIQSVFLGLGAYPLYKIAKNALDTKFALAIAISYLLYPALMYTNLFEFHPTALATCFLMFMLYYFYRDRFFKFIIFAILALSCQENISLLLMTTGCFAFFVKKEKKWIFIPIAIGSVYFYLSIFKIMPHFNNGTIEFESLYSHLGDNLPKAALSMVLNPAKTLCIMFSPENIFLLFQLFAPLVFLPLFYPPLLAAALPIFMQHMFSLRFMEHTIFYHYSAELMPFIFAASVYGIKRLTFVLKKPVERRAFLWLIVIVAIVSSVHMGPLGKISEIIDAWKSMKEISFVKNKFINQILPGSSVAATFEFLPKLSNRKGLYSFHHFYQGLSTLSTKKYILPQRIDYTLINFNDRHTFVDFYSSDSNKNMSDFLLSYNMGIIDFMNDVVLYKNGAADNIKIYEILEEKPLPGHIVSAQIDGRIKLLGYDTKETGNNIFEMTFYWQCVKEATGDYKAVVYMENAKYSFVAAEFTIGYLLYPTSLWHAGEIIKDVHRFVLPKEFKTEVSEASLMLKNGGSGKSAQIHILDKESLTANGFVKLSLK